LNGLFLEAPKESDYVRQLYALGKWQLASTIHVLLHRLFAKNLHTIDRHPKMAAV